MNNVNAFSERNQKIGIICKSENNSFGKLISNYSEILNILSNNKKENSLKLLCFYKSQVHFILFNENEIIKVDSFKFEIKLSNLFYLSLLIKDNTEIVNYSFSFNFINDINNIIINLKENEHIKKVILCKLNLEFINNFKGLDEYKEEVYEEKLKEIEDKNIDIIKNNNNNLNLTIDKENNIDIIYIKIIISLIESKKISDYDYTYNIINQLDLKKIDITEVMFDKLNNYFIKEKDHINEYIIKCKKDLFTEKKLNFYYILIKYILKNSIYIYQIPQLLETRQLILKLWKANEISYDFINNNIKEKLDYVIETMLDSKYYFEISELPLIKLKEIMKYYKQNLFESKKDDISNIDYMIKNKKGFFRKYLNDYETAKKMNDRYPIINYLYAEENNEEKNNKKTESEIKDLTNKWNTIENLISNKKSKKIRKTTKDLLIKYFNDKNNKESLLKIFSQDIIDNLIKTDEYNKPKEKNNQLNLKRTYACDNINEQDNNSNLSFNTQIKSINNNLSINNRDNLVIDNNITFSLNEPLKDEDISKLINNNFSFILHIESIGNKKIINNGDIYDEDHNYIISYKKFINIYRYDIYKNNNNLLYNFIKELEERIIDNYKSNYTLKIKLEFKNDLEDIHYNNNYFNFTDCIYTLYEPITNKEIKSIDSNILINKKNSGYEFMTKNMNDIKYNNLKYYYVEKVEKYETNFKYIKQLENGNYVCWGNNNKMGFFIRYHEIKFINKFKNYKGSIVNVTELNCNNSLKEESLLLIWVNNKRRPFFIIVDWEKLDYKELKEHDNSHKPKCYQIERDNYIYLFNNGNTFSHGIYKNSLKVENSIVLTSNRSIPGGEDKLVFYNIKEKRKEKEITGYSFVTNPNGLTVMTKENGNIKKNIIICNCVQYFKEQKNGLLILEQSKENNSIKEFFYPTLNFKPYCICPLQNKLVFNIYDNDAFLVGGFDLEDGEGKIKLFIVKYDDKEDKIHYIKNIIISRDCEGIKSTVICINQSKKDGRLFINCSNGELFEIIFKKTENS